MLGSLNANKLKFDQSEFWSSYLRILKKNESTNHAMWKGIEDKDFDNVLTCYIDLWKADHLHDQ